MTRPKQRYISNSNLNRGLIMCHTMGGNLDLTGNRHFDVPATTDSGLTNNATLTPAGLFVDGADDSILFGTDPLTTTGDLTIIASVQSFNASSNRQIMAQDDSTDRNFQFRLSSSNNVQFIPFVGGSAFTATGTTTVETGKEYVVGARYDSSFSSGNISCWLNGSLEGTASASGNIDSDTGRLCVGARGQPSAIIEELAGYIRWFYVWDRPLSDAEMIKVMRKPRIVLRSKSKIFHPTVDSGVTVSATTDELTLTEYAATVAAGVEVSAATAQLTLTEYAATVATGVEVSATTDALTLTEYAATVAAGVEVSATTDALVLTEYAATVSIDVDISATTAALTLTEYAATIEVGVDVSATTDALTLTEYAATVAATVNVSATTDSLVLSTHRATVSVSTANDADYFFGTKSVINDSAGFNSSISSSRGLKSRI